MVIRQEGSGRQYKPNTQDNTRRKYKFEDLLKDYVGSLALYPIDMEKINDIFIPSLLFNVIFIPQLVLAYAINLYMTNKFDIWSLLLKSFICVLAVIIFSFLSGYYLRWLISKPNDTSPSSYVFAVLMSCVYLPPAILIGSFGQSFRWIVFLVTAVVSEYICSTNMMREHTFFDQRSHFIFRIMLLILFYSFIIVIIPNI